MLHFDIDTILLWQKTVSLSENEQMLTLICRHVGLFIFFDSEWFQFQTQSGFEESFSFVEYGIWQFHWIKKYALTNVNHKFLGDNCIMGKKGSTYLCMALLFSDLLLP